MDKSNTYQIGDIAQQLGLSTRTVRYYEELGFIRPQRSSGGFRLYTERDADTIRMVIRFRDLGMALEEIKALISPSPEGISQQTVQRLREALAFRREEFEHRIEKYREGIAQIERVLQLLESCEHCDHHTALEPCKHCFDEDGAVSPFLHQVFHAETK